MKKKKAKYLLAAAAATVVAATALWPGLAVRTYQVRTTKLSEPIRVVLLTDLHSTVHGRDQSSLIAKIEEQQPDVILLAGDIVDDKKPVRGAELLLSAIGHNYPCFYVTGNHEFYTRRADEIKDYIRSFGVTVLEGTGESLSVNGQEILICGVDDPRGSPGWREQLEDCEALVDGERFSILLSHRPERVEDYAASGFDLVAAGHAHGGQVRIPGLLNGLLTPNQGLFPKYAGGLYDLGGTELVVSRGLSLNLLLPRVFNPPEVVAVEILPA